MQFQIIDEDFLLENCFNDNSYLETFLTKSPEYLKKMDWNYFIIIMMDNDNYKNESIKANLRFLFTLIKSKKITINGKELYQFCKIANKNNGSTYYKSVVKEFPEIKKMKTFIVRKMIFGF